MGRFSKFTCVSDVCVWILSSIFMASHSPALSVIFILDSQIKQVQTQIPNVQHSSSDKPSPAGFTSL